MDYTNDGNILISYNTWNIESKSWLNEVTSMDGNYSGNFGDSICCINASPNVGNLYYRVHCKDGMWTPRIYSSNPNNDNILVYLDNYEINVICGNWLSEIKTSKDSLYDNFSYGGVFGSPIDAFAIKSDSFELIYRAHLKERKKWAEWVTGYDLNDSEYGYAGIFGEEIDAIEIRPII